MAESIWSRPPAPARETLTRAQIVQAALEILDTDGVAGLSMRKLAAKLDAGATSLYWHVPTKDDLLDLVVDEVWGEVDVPEPELAGWRSGVLLFAHSLRAMMLRHLWLAEVINTRPSMGPNAMKFGTRGLILFQAGGFEGLHIDFAMSSVMMYVFGSAGVEASWRAAVKRTGKTVTEWVDDVKHRADPLAAAHPEVRASLDRRDIDQHDLQNRTFAFGLEALLTGLEAGRTNLTPPGPGTEPA